MPDGAFEHLNEAAFRRHDVLFSEGDDPIEINPEPLEAIAYDDPNSTQATAMPLFNRCALA